MDYLQAQHQDSNKYARQALTQLYFAIRRNHTIHFYNETNQSIDHVLDIFIRTNHGGTPLAFSDLLMSIAVANWKKDARQQIDDLVNQVRFGSDMEFSIDRDFVLKTALMLSDVDVRFKVKNFTKEQVGKIEQEWEEIKLCILEVFRLIRSFGLNDASLRAKNAAIPIAYYLFHKGLDRETKKMGLHADINSQARHVEERKLIRRWLHMSLLKGVFGGQGDALLTNLRKIIRSNLSNGKFPIDKIINDYRGSTKDLLFDDDFIDRLLKTQKEDSSCFSILALLFPDIDFTQSLDIDHLHPGAAFRKERLDAKDFLSQDAARRAFYENPENWNSILNLHLLNSSKNRSKQDMPLDRWLETQSGIKVDDLLIPSDVDLRFESFEHFVSSRFDLLKRRLRNLSVT